MVTAMMSVVNNNHFLAKSERRQRATSPEPVINTVSAKNLFISMNLDFASGTRLASEQVGSPGGWVPPKVFP